MESLGTDEVDEEQDRGGEQRRRRRRHEGGEGETQVGCVLGAVPQEQELRDQTQDLRARTPRGATKYIVNGEIRVMRLVSRVGKQVCVCPV